jgi:hypothetical protein
METESQVEFHQRWVKTAEEDLESVRRERSICIVALLITSAGYLASQFAPWHWAKMIHLFLSVPFVICLLYAGLLGSKLRDAREFLAECSRGLANEIQSNP